MKNNWDYSQPKHFKFAEDSIGLAKYASTHLGKNLKGIDLFSGCGVVGLEVLQTRDDLKLDFLENNVEMLSHLKSNIETLNIDTNLYSENFFDTKLPESYDFFLANPPFYDLDSSRLPPSTEKMNAKFISFENWKIFLRKSLSLLKESGRGIFILSKAQERIYNHTCEFLEDKRYTEISLGGSIILIDFYNS